MTATGMTLGAKSWAKVYTEGEPHLPAGSEVLMSTIWTTDPAILEIVTKAMKVFSIVIALDAIQGMPLLWSSEVLKVVLTE